MEERITDVGLASAESQTQTIDLPASAHVELTRLTQAVAQKRLELDNAQLRAELALRKVMEELGVAGRSVSVDLDAGFVVVRHDSDAGK